jgi:hypothetical protein
MAARDFLLSLRTAARLLSPSVSTEGTRLDADHLTGVLRRATIWLTPSSVDGFDPHDLHEEFPELSEQDREQLIRDVAEFRLVAGRVPGDQPASQEQVEAALAPFLRILSLMQPYMEQFQVNNALRRGRFPSTVRDFAVKVGDDSTGEKAVWVWVIVSDEVDDEDFKKGIGEIKQGVEDALRRAGIDLYPYVRFRTMAEQKELEASPVR